MMVQEVNTSFGSLRAFSPIRFRSVLIFPTPCIVLMFLLPRTINRGSLRSAGISRFFAKPLRLHWLPSLASASSGCLLFTSAIHTRATIPSIWDASPRTLGFSDARLVTSMSCSISMLSETPGGRLPLVYNAASVSLATSCTVSAHTQNSLFSELWFRFRAYTLHLD